MIKDYFKKKAAKLAAITMSEAAEDDTADIIKLVKEPGKAGNTELIVRVHMEYSEAAIIPYYVGRIIAAAAKEVKL